MLASMTIFPLVQGGGWWLALGIVAAVVAGTGLLVRRFTSSPALVVATQVAMWAVVTTVIFLPRQAYAGLLPGPDAIEEGRRLFDLGLRVMHRAAPPVDDTPGVIFVTAGGLTLVALLVDVLAVTLRRPAVAGLPLLAVYCVPAAVLPDGLPWPYFLLAALGFLVLVGVDSVDRVQAWGRVLAGTDSQGRSSIAFGGARKIASVSLAFAVVLPLLVPGLGERVLGEHSGTGAGKGAGGGAVVLNPLLNLRQDLTAPTDAPLFTYQTTMTDPQPLRVVVDDVFTGDTWEPSTTSVPQDQRPQAGAPDPEGLTDDSVARQRQTTDVTIGNLAQSYLPLPYPWSKVAVKGDWYYDLSTRTVVGTGQTTQGLSYTVDHFTVGATAAQLRSVPGPDPAILERYTQLPQAMDPEIAKLAATHASTGTAFDQAENLRNWLRGFTYSLDAPGNGPDDSGMDAVLAFLKERKGYCVHFASAMAVMARTLNIPSRVVVGFLPGSEDAQGTWTVRLKDAHAWPELYFQGVGWVRFEPTPAARTQNVGDVVGGGAQQQPTASAGAQSTASASATNGRRKPEDPAPGSTAAATAGAQVAGWRRVADALPWPWLAAGGVLVLAALSPMLAAGLSRRRRWRAAESRAGRAEAAFDELAERLADLGLQVSPAWTPRELRQWLVGAEHVPPNRTESLDRIVGALESARYAPPGGDGPPAGELRDAVDEVVRVVAEQVPAGRRRLARFLPRSGVRALTGAARQADVVAEDAGRRVLDQVDEVRKLVGGRRR